MSIRDRLENWALSVRGGSPYRGADCMTGAVCDRMRRAALGDVWSGANARPDLDEADAAVINAAWLKLPRRERFFLKFLYIDNAAVAFICRKFSIKQRPASCFEIERARIEKFLENRVVNREDLAQNMVTI